MSVFTGRYRAQIDGDFVVFIIGMRVNRPWKVRQWLPVFLAMPKMIKELEGRPETGFLAANQGLMYGCPALVQFWRSFDDLDRFARDPASLHLPAWREFNKRVRGSGDVGIWHETYKVRAGDYEAIYNNMPRVGLAGIAEHLPLGSTSTAATRIGEREEDVAPVAAY